MKFEEILKTVQGTDYILVMFRITDLGASFSHFQKCQMKMSDLSILFFFQLFCHLSELND